MNRRWSVLIACCYFLVGCSGSSTITEEFDSSPQDSLEVTTQDAADAMDGSTDGTADESHSPFVLCGEAGGCLFESCQSDDDCASEACVLYLGEWVCTTPCDGDCPRGFQCVEVEDQSHLCLSPHSSLCKPCRSDDECRDYPWQEALCATVSPQSGSFCTTPCNQDENCPLGFECRMAGDTAGFCQPLHGECGCATTWIQEGSSTECWQESEDGSCPGSRTCLEQGLSDCDAPIPGPELCDGLDNNCNGPVDEDVTCDDANSCTQDSCQGTQGCLHSPLSGPDCDDENACTLTDRCNEGVCVGELDSCDDQNPCTRDECDEGSGCSHFLEPYGCDDNNLCTRGDRCEQGACLSGEPVNCDDGQPCTTDICDPETGCQYSLACDQGMVCDGQGACCQPRFTCGELAHECGLVEDGCGNSIDCGGCDSPEAECQDGVCVSHGACQPVLLSRLGGQMLDVVVVQQSAFVAMGNNGLVRFDVANPAVPHYRGKLQDVETARLLALDGDLLYVQGDDTLVLVDVSDPTEPHAVGTVPFLSDPVRIVVEAGVAFVARASNRVTIVDATDPSLAGIRGDIDLGNRMPLDLALQGALLAVVTPTAGTALFDVSNLDEPEELSSVGHGSPGRCAVMTQETLYLLAATGGLRAFDLSDPENPTFLYATPLAGDEQGPCRLFGQWMLVPGDDELHVLDAWQGPPQEIHSLPLDGKLLGLDYSGQHLFLAQGFPGVDVYTAPDFDDLVPVGSLHLPVFNVALGERAGLLMAIESSGVVDAIDIRNPQLPVAEERLEVPGRPTSIAVTPWATYVASVMAGLLVIPVGDEPWQPVYGDSTLLMPSRIDVQGNLLAMSDYSGKLALYDLENPLEPGLISVFPGTGPWYDVDLSGTLAFIAAGSSGVFVVDLAAAEMPAPLANYPSGALGDAVQVLEENGVLFVLYFQSAPVERSVVVRYEVANPLSPVNAGIVAQSIGYGWFTHLGTRLFLLTPEAGIAVMQDDGSDVESPEALLPSGAFTSPPLLSSGYLLVGSEDGLVAVDIRTCYP